MGHARVIQLAGTWAVRFPDPAGEMRKPTANGHIYPVERTLRVSCYKEAADAVCRHITHILDAKRSGEGRPPLTAEWIRTLPMDWRRKLTAWGLLDAAASADLSPLDSHVAAYQQHLEANPKSRRRAPEAARRVRTMARYAEIAKLSAITPGAIERGMSKMNDEGLASNTVLVHRQAIVSFCHWLTRDGRLAAFPLTGLSAVSASSEQDRRALDLDEQRHLLATTAASPARIYRNAAGVAIVEVSGPERALAYELVLTTGLRNSELRGLRAGWFQLAATQPVLRLPPKGEKAKRGYTFTLPGSIIPKLRQHLAKKAPAAAAFNLPRADAMADMVRDDLAAARRLWIDAAGQDHDEKQRREQSHFLTAVDAEGGVFDFHALRATFVTNLARAGVSLFHASKLARHTDPRLTARIYAKLGAVDEREAIDKLPDLSFPIAPVEARATGTAGDTRALQKLRPKTPQASPTLPFTGRDAADARAENLLEQGANSPRLSKIPQHSQAADRTRTGDLRFTKTQADGDKGSGGADLDANPADPVTNDDPELDSLMRAWPSLPTNIRSAIAALIAPFNPLMDPPRPDVPAR